MSENAKGDCGVGEYGFVWDGVSYFHPETHVRIAQRGDVWALTRPAVDGGEHVVAQLGSVVPGGAVSRLARFATVKDGAIEVARRLAEVAAQREAAEVTPEPVRPITFAKQDEGLWLNRETGVRIWGTPQRGYVVEQPVYGDRTSDGVLWRRGCGGWGVVVDRPCTDMNQARGIATRVAERMRHEIGEAYDAAHVEDMNLFGPSAPQVTHLDLDFGSGLACGDGDPWAARTIKRREADCPDCITAMECRDFDRAIKSMPSEGLSILAERMVLRGIARGTREAVVLAHDVAAEIETAEPTCTSGWADDPHAFTSNPSEPEPHGIRCSKRRGDAIHFLPQKTNGGTVWTAMAVTTETHRMNITGRPVCDASLGYNAAMSIDEQFVNCLPCLRIMAADWRPDVER